MRSTALIALSIIFSLTVAGCSTHSRTVTTESAYETSRSDQPRDTTVVRQTESRETYDQKSSEPTGIISGTLDIVGKTLALPFRAVGGLIDVIF